MMTARKRTRRILLPTRTAQVHSRAFERRFDLIRRFTEWIDMETSYVSSCLQ